MGNRTIAQNLEGLERVTIHYCDDNKILEVNPLTGTKILSSARDMCDQW